MSRRRGVARDQLAAFLQGIIGSNKQLLSLGAWKVAGDPGPLHPKSPASRTDVALGKPLQRHEQQDLTLVNEIAERWLALIPNADEDTLELISDAVHFAQAFSRDHSSLMERITAPDREDASAWRDHDRRMSKRQSKIAKRPRPKKQTVSDEQIRDEVKTARGDLKRAAVKLGITEGALRKRLRRMPTVT